MKIIKYFLIIIIILGGLGYGLYHFGTKIASEKLMEALMAELENSGEMENIKRAIESDPELRAFINDAQSADASTLPFTTKEEATRVIVKKFGISGIKDIQTKVQEGRVSKEEILQNIEEKLTEEEITALKVIAYKEIYNK
ncbi:hypothetical protein [Paucisalibacillus sp. EB02]|uniref:hypothetical protein n=1 Tax=Paucisalibacillus sp. EB02 TaxID=1347087 RepID=UPI0004B99B49|nr:hypothetical protein [Paucisalibacillus sp. EB02]